MNGPIQKRHRTVIPAVLMRKNVVLMQLNILTEPPALHAESANVKVYFRACAGTGARAPHYAALTVNYTFYGFIIIDPCCVILLIDGIVFYLNNLSVYCYADAIESIVNLYCRSTAANIKYLFEQTLGSKV